VKVALRPDAAFVEEVANVVRRTCKTYDLFNLVRLLLRKGEAFQAEVTPKRAEHGGTGALYVTVADELPFATDQEAIDHVLTHQLDRFFTIEETEVPPPKGNFVCVSKCGITGELLGAPNWHRYHAIMREHHARRLRHMPFEAFQARIESVREKEVIDQWIAQMSRGRKFIIKDRAEGEPESFTALEDARRFLLLNRKAALIRAAEVAVVSGSTIEKLPADHSVRRAIEAMRIDQMRFPFDFAQRLRDALKPHRLVFFKKGAKGVSYVSAVNQKRRDPSVPFAPAIERILSVIGSDPHAHKNLLAAQVIGVEKISLEDVQAVAALTPVQHDALAAMLRDLRWLTSEGYVTEYEDGRLQVPTPPSPKSEESRKGQEHGGRNKEKSGHSGKRRERGGDRSQHQAPAEVPEETEGKPSAATGEEPALTPPETDAPVEEPCSVEAALVPSLPATLPPSEVPSREPAITEPSEASAGGMSDPESSAPSPLALQELAAVAAKEETAANEPTNS
jgi:hypothetical protein